LPLFTFKCSSCCQTREVLQLIKDEDPICKRCADASCGVHIPEMKRVWKKIGRPQFKGSGFYETDYKNSKPPS